MIPFMPMRLRYRMPIAVLLSLCAGCASMSGVNARYLQALDRSDYFSLDSVILERRFHIYVRSPATPEAGRRYPTVYLLDGGLTYPLLAGHLRYLQLGEELPEVVLVGVSYGASEFRRGNMRSIDFTAPSAERDFWGGASRFLEVLETELIPSIESQYPVDPESRMIFGQSLGGQFVLFAARERPDLFAGYIASNPALHRNLDFFLRDIDRAVTPKPKLYVSMGSHEMDELRPHTEKWIAYWSAQTLVPWQLRTEVLPGQSHVSAGPEAFRRGVRWILSSD